MHENQMPIAPHGAPAAPVTRRSVIRWAAGGLILVPALSSLGRNARASTRSTAPASGPADATPATLQLSWTHSVQFGGSYLAADRGYYTDEGIDITFGAGGPNVAGDAQTVSGAALVNISVGDGVARSNSEGAGLTIVGMQYQRSPATLLSLAAAAITTPADVVGTRIAVAGSDTPALDAFLRYNDIDADDVEMIPSQYDPAVLTAGQADSIFCFYNDLPVALEVQGIDHATLLLADYGYNPASQVYTVLAESLEDERRDLVMAMLRAEIRGWQDYRTDFEAAAELAVEAYPDAGLDLEVQRVQAEVQLDLMYDETTDEHGFAWFTDEVIASNLELFEELGIPDVTPDLFDRSLLEEIFADGPTL